MENVIDLVEWFEGYDVVDYVIYVGLKLLFYYDWMVKICLKGVFVFFMIFLKGGYDVCVKLVDSFEIFSYVVNFGDVCLLIIYLVLIMYC